jgi:hypothetical protein
MRITAPIVWMVMGEYVIRGYDVGDNRALSDCPGQTFNLDHIPHFKDIEEAQKAAAENRRRAAFERATEVSSPTHKGAWQ